jgi:hypothetical protein
LDPKNDYFDHKNIIFPVNNKIKLKDNLEKGVNDWKGRCSRKKNVLRLWKEKLKEKQFKKLRKERNITMKRKQEKKKLMQLKQETREI